VSAVWEEMKTGVDEENESDCDNEGPPSPEDWHSQVPSVSVERKKTLNVVTFILIT